MEGKPGNAKHMNLSTIPSADESSTSVSELVQFFVGGCFEASNQSLTALKSRSLQMEGLLLV